MPDTAQPFPDNAKPSLGPKAKLAVAPSPQQPPAFEAFNSADRIPAADVKKHPTLVRRVILGVAGLAVLTTAGYYGHDWWTIGRFNVTTNDAYVQTDMSQLGAKVPGYVAEIPVAENSLVKTGDVVLRLDNGDYRLAVDAAKAKIATQKAVIASFTSQAAAQQAQISAAEAKHESAQAALANAAITQKRASDLAARKIASQQTLDTANTTLQTATASVTESKAGITAAKAQIDVLDANRVQAERVLSELNTALAKAERDMSFTEIRAPLSGIVANRAVEPGQYVQAGTRLMALIPANASYIEANFKETQLAELHPGQKASITVDALGSKKYIGQVVSLSPASGSEFSLLPPENATGNFTKITQRVPVRVSVPAELAASLRPGLSVTVTVDSRDSGQP